MLPSQRQGAPPPPLCHQALRLPSTTAVPLSAPPAAVGNFSLEDWGIFGGVTAASFPIGFLAGAVLVSTRSRLPAARCCVPEWLPDCLPRLLPAVACTLSAHLLQGVRAPCSLLLPPANAALPLLRRHVAEPRLCKGGGRHGAPLHVGRRLSGSHGRLHAGLSELVRPPDGPQAQ